MAMGAARIIAMALLVMLAGCGSAQEKAAKAAARYDYFYAKRNFYAARVEIRRALAQQDDVPEYWARLARVQLALGRMLDAYMAYQSVIDLDPRNKDAVQALAELAYVGQSYDDSEKFADQILTEQPRSLRMLLVKGSIAAARQDPVKAQAIAAQMLEIDPTNEGATILLARTQRMHGDRSGAIATLERSISRDGETPGKLLALLNLYSGRHDFRKIASTFARLFALAPDDIPLRLEYVRILYDQGLPDRALAMLARLVRRQPGNPQLEQKIVDLWNATGSKAVDVDRVRRFVMASGDRALKIALGHLLLEQKRYAEAETVLRPFIDRGEINAQNVEADVRYAGALSGLGRAAEAQALIDRILEFDENNPRALLMRVNIAMAHGDLATALRDAQRLVADNPLMTEARIALGQIYVRRNEPVLADDAYARAMNEANGDAAMLAAFTRYQLDKGRPSLALDAAKRFVRENPTSREGWYQRAKLCIDLADAACAGQSLNGLDQIAGGPKLRLELEQRWQARRGSAKTATRPAVMEQAGTRCDPMAGAC